MQKIVKSSDYHQIATHDFKNVLKPLNDIKKLETLVNKEFGFFINATKHVERECKKYNIKLPMKCVLITFGRKFRYIRSNYLYISYQRLLRVKILSNSILMDLNYDYGDVVHTHKHIHTKPDSHRQVVEHALKVNGVMTILMN